MFVHNYLPSRVDAFGLDYDTLRAINPKLVYCEITGWGSTGPRREEPGYDMIASAVGGFMHITGEPDGPPSKVSFFSPRGREREMGRGSWSVCLS